MTIFGWDASNHDWGRGPMDFVAARADGVDFVTHKACEGNGFYRDSYIGLAIARARAAQIPVYGAYFVLHPGDPRPQADYFGGVLDEEVPGWRTDPRFIVQLDAERFDYMIRAPSPNECRAWCDYIKQVTGRVPLVYAPSWLYGDSIGIGYPLWASNYGANPVAHYRAAYVGDTSGRWAAYSGATPAILQFGSRLTIGRQPTCDANAFRGSVDDLLRLAGGSPEERSTSQMPIYIVKDTRDGSMWRADGVCRTPLGSSPSELEYWVRKAPGVHIHADNGDPVISTANPDLFGHLAVDPDVVAGLAATLETVRQQLASLTTAVANVDGIDAGELAALTAATAAAAHDGAAAGTRETADTAVAEALDVAADAARNKI